MIKLLLFCILISVTTSQLYQSNLTRWNELKTARILTRNSDRYTIKVINEKGLLKKVWEFVCGKFCELYDAQADGERIERLQNYHQPRMPNPSFARMPVLFQNNVEQVMHWIRHLVHDFVGRQQIEENLRVEAVRRIEDHINQNGLALNTGGTNLDNVFDTYRALYERTLSKIGAKDSVKNKLIFRRF